MLRMTETDPTPPLLIVAACAFSYFEMSCRSQPRVEAGATGAPLGIANSWWRP